MSVIFIVESIRTIITKINMKKLLILLMTFSTSCKTIPRNQNLQGNYYKKGNDYVYSLTLNSDISFVLKLGYFEVDSECKGKWLNFYQTLLDNDKFN